MDILKNLISNRQEQIKLQGKLVKIGDVEKERERQYFEEQQKKEQKEKEKRQQQLEELEKLNSNPYKKLKQETYLEDLLNAAKKETEKPPIPYEEIIKKLRQFGDPITFFGETDMQRYKRLRKLEIEQMENKNQGGNVFDKFLKMDEDDFRNKQKQDDQYIDDDKINNLFKTLREQDNFLKEENTNENIGIGQKKKQTTEKIKKVSDEQKNQDVYIWAKKILKDWETKLDERFKSGEDKKTAQGQKLIGTYRQTIEYLKPLFTLLKEQKKEQKCPEEILDGLYVIAHYCLMREYSKANDKYLQLAIGNAAWPMGVTMVGIHERAGRSKIFSSQVAHILNDETTRKYLHSIKRLITVSQLVYPADDKSKMVNFDTLMEELF